MPARPVAMVRLLLHRLPYTATCTPPQHHQIRLLSHCIAHNIQWFISITGRHCWTAVHARNLAPDILPGRRTASPPSWRWIHLPPPPFWDCYSIQHGGLAIPRLATQATATTLPPPCLPAPTRHLHRAAAICLPPTPTCRAGRTGTFDALARTASGNAPQPVSRYGRTYALGRVIFTRTLRIAGQTGVTTNRQTPAPGGDLSP